MTDKRVLELIDDFAKKGSFKDNIWNYYRLAKKSLLAGGEDPIVYKSLIKSLERKEENVVIHCAEILADIGNEKTISFISKIEFRADIMLFPLYGPNIIKILETKSTFNLVKFSQKPTEELIDIFSKHGSSELNKKNAFILEEHYYAKIILIKRGEQVLPNLFKIINLWEKIALEIDFNSVLFQTEEYCKTKLNNIIIQLKLPSINHLLEQREQGKTCLILDSILLSLDSIIAEVAEVLGEIGDVSAIDYLKKILRYYCTGITSRKVASALVKLNDKTGYDFLVDRVRNSDINPEVRIKCAAELYYLGLKNVFKRSEAVDLKERPGQDLTILKKLVERMREDV